MKTITLKTGEEFFEYLENLSKKLGKPKSQIIREAVIEYGEKIKREKIHQKMEKLARQLSKDKNYLKEIKEFEELSEDFIE
ncbi:ribbon-helix-helix domain-containing protein [Persephonella sp.]|uniref:ribbon-helix-helix domain-containing protein n=1 Tax=Persephonella sp. TaxID=2060922 RepID=UPI0026052AEB|nr:ribbon-helix-helix domain-containing protein [Persephonella sp.]